MRFAATVMGVVTGGDVVGSNGMRDIALGGECLWLSSAHVADALEETHIGLVQSRSGGVE